MTHGKEERLFERFRRSGDPRALATVFDRCAPELYRVAFHLCGEVAAAEDLLQTCFVQVIEHRQRFREGERLLPWMLGILANLARRRQRAMRPIDGSRLTRPDPISPLEAAEHAEFRAELRRAIDSLPDSYREILSLHLLHGLKTREIAELLKRPAGSLRTQILRGMEQLRRALPASFAGGVAIMTAPGQGLAVIRARVLEHAGVPAKLASSFAIGLFGTVFTMKKLLATAAAMVLVISLAVLAEIDWAGSKPITPAPIGVDPEGVSLAATDRPTSEGVTRQAADEAIAGSADSGDSGLLVQVSYAGDEAAAAGVRIYLVDGPSNRWQVLNSGVTDAQGLVELAASSGQVFLRSDRGTRVTEALVASAPGEVNMLIESGMDLSGRCIDEFGRPIAGASVHAQASDFPEEEGRVLAYSMDDGSFTIRAVESDMVKIWATSPGRRRSQQQVFWGGKGSEHQAELELADQGCMLTGRVLDRQGKPVPSAPIYIVREQPTDNWDEIQEVFLRADESGQFVVPDLWPGSTAVFAIDEQGGHALASLELSEDRTQFLELQMVLGATVYGVLRDQHGKPWSRQDLSVSWQGSAIAERTSSIADHMGTSEEDGSFRIEGLLPGNYRLSAGWAADRKYDLVAVVDGQTHEWNPIIRRGTDQALRLIDSTGDGLAGWRVTLLYMQESRQVGRPPALRPAANAYTDDQGRVTLYNLMIDAGELVITEPEAERLSTFGQMGNLPTMRLGEFHVSGEITELQVDVATRPRAILEGRLSDASGTALPGVELILRWNDYFLSLRMRSLEDGSFRFSRLPAGQYQLLAMRDSHANFETVCKRDVDGTEQIDLGKIELADLCRIQFHVQTPDGKPCAGLSLSLRRSNPPRSMRELQAGEPGSYSSRSVHPGDHTLQIVGPGVMPTELPFSLEAGQSLAMNVEVKPALDCRMVLQFEGEETAIYGTFTVLDAQSNLVFFEELNQSFNSGKQRRIELTRGLARGSYRAIFRDGMTGEEGSHSFTVGSKGQRVEMRY